MKFSLPGQKLAIGDIPVEAFDRWLMVAYGCLLLLGLVMISSASIAVADHQMGDPFYFLKRQAVAALLGGVAILFMLNVRLVYWEKAGMLLLGFVFFILLLVLIPGVGKTVNGSTRWIPVGFINLQVSELAKLFMIVYVSGYLVRHGEQVRSSLWGFIKPMFMVGLVCVLLLLEPDFGASAVIMMTVLSLMFIGGVRFYQFLLFISLFVAAAGALIVSSPYRMERLTTFLNPWADPFDGGFQLTQSLIAIGSGGVTGVGLGDSVQKLFYLPEAHTDFLFAVLAEELGLVGVIAVLSLYGLLLVRVFKIARQAETGGNLFAGYLAYGIGIWLALQAFINIGVNMGILPTKGLTLPFMSYGGSSLIVCSAAIGLVLRVYYENVAGQAKSIKRKPAKSPGKRERRVFTHKEAA